MKVGEGYRQEREPCPLPAPAEERARRGEDGFTLLELIIVMVIIGILAARIIPSFVGRTEDAKVAKAKTDIENLSAALDLYEADNGFYPTTEQGLAALWEAPTTDPVPEKWNGPYLRRRVETDPWGRDYHYLAPGDHNPQSFDLFSYGRDGREGGSGPDADLTNWNAKQ